MIYHSSPTLPNKTFKQVNALLKNGMIANGLRCEEFKFLIKNYFKVDNVILTNSGTSALFVALKILNTQKTEIILPSYVCKDVIEATILSGFKPVLCDIEEFWNVSYNSIKNKISKNTAAIIVPHNLGICAKVIEIKKFGIPIIEDCCQSIGSSIYTKLCGTIGDIAVLSFNATKCLTTAEGGAVLINNNSVVNKTVNINALEHLFRMSDLQALVGITQIKLYNSFLKKRSRIAKLYFNKIDSRLTQHFSLCKKQSMFFRFLLFSDIDFNKTKQTLEKKDIAIRKGIDSLLHRDYKLGKDKDFKNSVHYYNHTISIPIYPNLTLDEINYITTTVNSCIYEN
jgi:perosamine synthetase